MHGGVVGGRVIWSGLGGTCGIIRRVFPLVGWPVLYQVFFRYYVERGLLYLLGRCFEHPGLWWYSPMLSREIQHQDGEAPRRETLDKDNTSSRSQQETNERVAKWARDARTYFTRDLGSADGEHNTQTRKVDKDKDLVRVTWGPLYSTIYVHGW